LSLYWWNPLAWTAWHEFLKERESATDDLVLSTGARASEYADDLLEIARAMQLSPAPAAVAMARRSQLEGRLSAILDSGRNRKAAGRASAIVAALLTLAVVAPLAALRAQEGAPETLPADVDATIRAALNFRTLDDIAKAAEAQQKYDMAQKLLEAALALREKGYGQRSVDYGVGLLNLGDLERSRGRIEESAAFYTRAVSVLGTRPEAAPALIHLGAMALGNKKNEDQAADCFQKAQIADPRRRGLDVAGGRT